MYPLKYWFKIFRILFALSINGDTGTKPKKPKESQPANTSIPSTEPPRYTTTTAPVPTTSTSITTANLSLNLPQAPITTSSILTPSAQDIRVGWIYSLSKVDLQQEMEKFGLESEGTVDDLRKAFRDFLRHGFGEKQPNLTSKENTQSLCQDRPSNIEKGHVSFTNETGIAQSTNFPPPEKLENDSVREILGLPPNTDFREVQRALAILLLKAPLSDPSLNVSLGPNLGTKTTQSLRQPTMSAYHQEKNLSVGTDPEFRAQKPTTDIGNVCNQVRKWNLRFDGNRDPISFLERLNELIEAYDINHGSLLKALPELFKGQALYWYRNNKDSWRTYNDFIQDFEEYFLPPDYRRNLDEEIVRRTQGEQESFRNFVVALTMLMRRQGNYSKNDLLNRLYRNMRPEYKLTIRREQFQNVSELIKLAEGYESYVRDKKNYRPPPHAAQTLCPEAAFTTKNRSTRSVNVEVIEAEKGQQSIFPKPEPSVNRSNRGHNNYSQNKVHPFKNFNNSSASQTVNNRPLAKPQPICWNCEKVGHRFFECKLPKVIRCYNCKTEGVRTVHCPCRQGNEVRDQRNGGTLSLKATKHEQPPMSGKIGSTE